MKKKQQELFSKLILNNLIRVGKLDNNSGIKIFSPIDDLQGKTEEEILEYLNYNNDQLAFSTYSMGRVVFTVDDQFNFLQIKGVDSKLNILDYFLKRDFSIDYLFENSDQDYPLCLVKFDGHREYRYRGSMSKEEIIREMSCSEMLRKIGIITSNEMKEMVIFDQNQCDILRLPRPGEMFMDYLERLRCNISVKDENLYYQQFVFGQMKRKQNNIFRVSDLELALHKNDLKKIQLMFQFSIFQMGEQLNKEMDLNSYINSFSSLLGNQVGTLIDNMVINFNPVSNHDVTLSAELCDDRFYQFTLDSLNLDNNYYVHGQNRKQQIYLQIYTFANPIKFLIDSLALLDIDKKDVVVDSYLDSLVSRIGSNVNNYQLLLFLMEEMANERVIDSIMRVNEDEAYNGQISRNCAPNMEFYEEVRGKLKEKLLTNLAIVKDQNSNKLKKKSTNNYGKISTSFIIFTVMITLILLFVSMVYLLY